MRFIKKTQEKLVLLNLISLVTIFFWTISLLGLLAWAISKEERLVFNYARLEAKANFNKDVALRNWGAKRGGVYVQVSEDTPPNPYLAHIPDRDIITPDGKHLTLMNPAYMLRQIMNEFSELYGIKGRITSLQPFNPINAPDSWEIRALEQFEQGIEEVSEVAHIEGKFYLRYMQAFYTKEGCLKCHPGYNKGDIRGGVGVSVPLEPYLEIKRHTVQVLVYSYAFLWFFGCLGILLVNRFVKQQIHHQERTEQALREKTAVLKSQTAELERLNAILSQKALYDGLTHVYNRRAFDEHLAQAWHNWQHKQHFFSLIIADIDFFKQYNDDCGHLVGDACLTTVAQNIRTTVAEKGSVARYGGEEFAIILPGIGLEQALHLAEGIRRAVEALAVPHHSSRCTHVLTLSLGVAASYQSTAQGKYNELLSLADQALYEAKNQGRNRVCSSTGCIQKK
jgi:diguanylate cyclase (GGDEF)-like protein